MATSFGSSLDKEELNRAFRTPLNLWDMKKATNRCVQYQTEFDQNTNYNNSSQFIADFRNLRYKKHDVETAEMQFPITIYDTSYTSYLSNGVAVINSAGIGLTSGNMTNIAFASDLFAILQRVTDIAVGMGAEASLVAEDQIHVWKADRLLQKATRESLQELAEVGIFPSNTSSAFTDTVATAQRLAYFASLNPVYDATNRAIYIIPSMKMRLFNNFRSNAGIRKYGFQIDITTTQNATGGGRQAFYFANGTVPSGVTLAWRIGIPSQQNLSYRYRELACSKSANARILKNSRLPFSYESTAISSNPIPSLTQGQQTKLIVANCTLPQAVTILGFPTGALTGGVANFPGNAYPTSRFTQILPFVNENQLTEQPSVTLEAQYQDRLETNLYYPTATLAPAQTEEQWLVAPAYSNCLARESFRGDLLRTQKVELQYTKTDATPSNDYIFTYFIRGCKWTDGWSEERGRKYRCWNIDTDLKCLDVGEREPEYEDEDFDWGRRR
jgi:hypothetical protein